MERIFEPYPCFGSMVSKPKSKYYKPPKPDVEAVGPRNHKPLPKPISQSKLTKPKQASKQMLKHPRPQTLEPKVWALGFRLQALHLTPKCKNMRSLGQMYRIGSFADDAAPQRKWSIFDLFAPLPCQDLGCRLGA